MAASPGAGAAVPDSPSRREQILGVAAQLFARHGFHGVSIADLGAAVGVSGPALYRHFPGKEALLAEMLIRISEHLLAGGQERAAASDDPREMLAALIDFQVDFALREPELIVVQDRDLANLPPEPRRRVRLLQRTYVEIWVDVLRRINPDLTAEAARIAAHGAFGLLNSTPHSRTRAGTAEVAALLHRMAWTALTNLTPAESRKA
ncbi:SACE_7040 family transcriptional regulator [Pseudonocardia asaccharolytica]|uniref:TetR family transcriptional regulator n=1 Tax=Pseudonocardia asaccharolytica DSM 44247 = NBRC 16224 TaxID=1123024 RepID=A0A511CY44_9PSEU|nr:TetR/AcrR family transcriptional regulator [Pseudonocardia asaccharolytica]GEL17485.1 TetR family transcriptional regulator [Pseudonocardia asaccharolytica DSM 44247 = NBRC 16224]